jgi:hypothetical protein
MRVIVAAAAAAAAAFNNAYCSSGLVQKILLHILPLKGYTMKIFTTT